MISMTLTQARPALGAALAGRCAATGNCPYCKGTFETCGCRGGVAVPTTLRAPWADSRTTAEEIGRQDDRGGDDGRGYDRDETDTRQHHRLVERLVADGDHRAHTAGRHARRTLGEMVPGHTRQPVLILHRPQMAGACPLCDKTPCRPMCPFRATPVSGPAALATGSARKAS
ncbi:hypothetical protein [Streptomyces sp. NBC_01237]|uniref:hypothetical protein n=1 Tax=Streptomyces sp. NBC_01237 TaxID=2903790 RepID=UPI002DD8FD50|nr:hypothetical protein [Streptomyces sp. NBC_01237]WRZ76583.1 hypothetical protein OG251_35960 [Streptomyces sp. NBC_01237]